MKATSLCTYGGWDSITGVLSRQEAEELVRELQQLRPVKYLFYEPMGYCPEGYVYLTLTMPKTLNPDKLLGINALLDRFRDREELKPGLPTVMLYTTTTSEPGNHDNAGHRTDAPILPFWVPGMNK